MKFNCSKSHSCSSWVVFRLLEPCPANEPNAELSAPHSEGGLTKNNWRINFLPRPIGEIAFVLFHDLLLPDGILGTQDSGTGSAFGAIGFLKMIYFFPSTDSYSGTDGFSEWWAQSLFHHSWPLWKSIWWSFSDFFFFSVYPGGEVQKFRMKATFWHLACRNPPPSEVTLTVIS